MKNKIYKTTHFLKCVSFILILFFLSPSMNCKELNTSIKLKDALFQGSEWYYRFYSWQKQKNLEIIYYPNSEKEHNIYPQIEEDIATEKNMDDLLNNVTTTQSNHYNTKPAKPLKNTLQPPKKRIPGAIIHASLTSSPGSIAISGNRYQVNIQIDGQIMEKENFVTSATSGFTILAESNGTKKTFRVNSPSFGTNMIIHSLTLSINPLNNSASITGKLNLDLPGTMSGSLINLSNGTSSSCDVRHGYFSTTVSLSNGMNQLTAIGKWLTITLELPSISVIVQS